MPSNTPQDNRFTARTETRTDSKNLCFFHVRFGAKARKSQAPCSWQLRNSCNFDDNINYRVASYSCRLRKKVLPMCQSFFLDPCSNMRFLLDTGAEISMIPPCRYYKPRCNNTTTQSGPQQACQIFCNYPTNLSPAPNSNYWTIFLEAIFDLFYPIHFVRTFSIIFTL